MMLYRYLLILSSLLGISSTFMPWLIYPKPKAVLYGYLSDGLITGFIYLVFFTVSVYNFKKTRLNYLGSGMMAIISLWMGVEAYKKINAIELEKLNFSSDNPAIALATAGFHQGIGIYIMGIAGIAFALTSISALLFQYFNSDLIDNPEPKLKRKELIVLLSSFGTVALLVYFFAFGQMKSKPNNEELKKSISSSVTAMGKAIQTENYAAFINYNHPIMIQSYGGKQRTKDLLSATLQELKKSGYKVNGTALNQVLDIQINQNSIQAIITQKVTLDSMAFDKTQLQKMIAVSENNGQSWSFINIDGKTKKEIKDVFPLMNPNLKF